LGNQASQNLSPDASQNSKDAFSRLFDTARKYSKKREELRKQVDEVNNRALPYLGNGVEFQSMILLAVEVLRKSRFDR